MKQTNLAISPKGIQESNDLFTHTSNFEIDSKPSSKGIQKAIRRASNDQSNTHKKKIRFLRRNELVKLALPFKRKEVKKIKIIVISKEEGICGIGIAI